MKFWIIFVAIVAITMISVYPWIVDLWRYCSTQFADGFKRVEFSRIEKGMSLRNVYQIAGDPLYVGSSLSAEGTFSELGFLIESATYESALEIDRISSDSGKPLRLIYSWPKPRSNGHFRYEVSILNGRVIDFDEGIYID